MPIYLE